MKKLLTILLSFYAISPGSSAAACCYSETVVEECHIINESDFKDIENKVSCNFVWLIDIQDVGLYTCVAHRADGCRGPEYCHSLHADELEYITFGGRKMHVTKILDRIEDKDIALEIARAKTPESYHRAVRKIAKKMEGIVTRTPYPIIRIRKLKKHSGHSKSC